jgi:hypothetical protein
VLQEQKTNIGLKDVYKSNQKPADDEGMTNYEYATYTGSSATGPNRQPCHPGQVVTMHFDAHWRDDHCPSVLRFFK